MNSDKERKDKIGAGRPASAASQRGKLPLLELMLYLALAGITMMFAALVAVYLGARAHNGGQHSPFPLPRWFSLSTVVLLISSYVLAQAPRLYRADDPSGLARCLGSTLLLGLIFAGLQAAGWHELDLQGVFNTKEAGGIYLTFISGLHVVHLLGGIVLLGWLLYATSRAARDGISMLVFIRNPYWRLRLRLLGLYWHFIDALWVVLFTVFLFMF